MSQLAVGLGLVPAGDRPALRAAQPLRPAAVAGGASPSLLGIGIDEDTAAVIRHGRLTVVGKGSVTIVDGQNLVSNAYEAKRTAPLAGVGGAPARVAGWKRVDLATRSLAIFATPEEDLEVEDLRAAEADLRGWPGRSRPRASPHGLRPAPAADPPDVTWCASPHPVVGQPDFRTLVPETAQDERSHPTQMCRNQVAPSRPAHPPDPLGRSARPRGPRSGHRWRGASQAPHPRVAPQP